MCVPCCDQRCFTLLEVLCKSVHDDVLSHISQNSIGDHMHKACLARVAPNSSCCYLFGTVGESQFTFTVILRSKEKILFTAAGPQNHWQRVTATEGWGGEASLQASQSKCCRPASLLLSNQPHQPCLPLP